MKLFLKYMSVLMLLFSFVSCGISDLDSDEVMHYLESRYEREFTLISSQKVPRSQRKYLDPLEETVNEPVTDYNESDDIVDVYKDADGLQFHVWHYLRQGFVGSWIVRDDYAVQWLVSQPELYKPLEDSGFECTYFNHIGVSESSGFALKINEFSDIRTAAELAFDVIGNDAAVLPDHGIYNTKDEIKNDGMWQYPLIPSIYIQTKEGQFIGYLNFRTEQIPNTTDKENFIRCAECQYISFVKDGTVRDTLTSEQKSQEIKKDIPLYTDDEQICMMEANYSDKYCVNDLVKIGEKLDFANLRTICEYCGYTYKPKGKKIYITKGEDTVLISRRNGSGYNRSIYAVYKNGTPYIPDGDIDNELQNDKCSLTIADFQYLFGINISVDYDNGSAKVCK